MMTVSEILSIIMFSLPPIIYWFTVYKHHMIILYLKEKHGRKPETEIDIIFEWFPVINVFNAITLLMVYDGTDNLLERYLSI